MSKRSRQELSVDITPLIDVVFLLLIFFMTATVFKTDELSLLLNLPKVEKGIAAESEVKTTINIEVTATEIAINKKRIELSNIETLLKTIKDKTTPIEMRIDKDVKYDRVMQILSKLKKYELTNLALVTES